MSFSYSAGSGTPGLAGMLTFNSVVIGDTAIGASFKADDIPPISQTAPIRVPSSPLPNDPGGYVGTSLLDLWAFDVTGWLYTGTSGFDAQAAYEYLTAAFNPYVGLQQMVLNALGWSAKRFITCQVAGPVVMVDPGSQFRKGPSRDFTIPFVALDPRRYNNDLLRSTTCNGAGTLTNAGNAPAPFTVVFNGPRTNPHLIAPDTTQIQYTGVIASGHSVTVTTNPAAVGGVSAVDDSGANVYGNVSIFTARTVPPGSASWTGGSDSGAGNIVVTLRDTWS